MDHQHEHQRRHKEEREIKKDERKQHEHAEQYGHDDQPDNDRRRLDDIGIGHRPHPTKQGIDRHDHRSDQNRFVDRELGEKYVDH